MTKSTMLAVLTLLTLFCANAQTQEGPPKSERPKLILAPLGYTLHWQTDDGQQVTLRPTEDLKIFTTSEWTTTGNLIKDYEWLWYYAGRLEQQIVLRELEIEKHRAISEAHRTLSERTEANASRLTGLLDTEQAIRQETRSKATTELWLWRGATVVAVIAAAVFGTAYVIER